MVSSVGLNKILLLGALLIFGCRLAISYPAGTEDDDLMQNDDYVDDDDDQSSPIQPTNIQEPFIPQQNRSQTTTVTGILGEDVVLKCHFKIGEKSTVLWYQGSKGISIGSTVVVPNFSLNSTTYELTILKSSPQDAGDYYCNLLPDKAFEHVLVVLGDHSMDVIVPESSKSAQSSIHGLFLMLPLSAALLAALQHMKF
ncbi:hypothetical protein ACLKA6_001969 [Drosophila palustris]